MDFARALLLFVAAAAVGSEASALQYHAQDEWGQYAYGYSDGPSAKHERRTADGVTRGGYSYVDAHGVVQSVSYVSDPVNGFRAAGTNLPTEDHVVPVVRVAPPPAAVVRDVPAVSSVHSYSSAVVHHDAVPVPVVVHRLRVAPPPAAIVHDVPAVSSVHSYGSAVVHDDVVPLPVVHSYGSAVVHHPPPHAKVSAPLTPAGTSSLHYPQHPVLLAARRKKRSVVAPRSYYPGPAVVHLHRAIVVPVVKPVATSYASVTRHVPAAAVPVQRLLVPHVYYRAVAPVVPAQPHVYAGQYRAQDGHGRYAYGYADGESAKSETRYADGTTVGGYSYVDDRGTVQTVHYAAGADGFTAAGTNIPVHHV